MLRILAIALLFFLTGTLSAQYQILRKVYDTKTNSYAEITCLFGKLSPYGYAPIRITINNGSKVDRNFTLDFTSRDSSGYSSESGSRMTSSFSCSCAAGSRETYDFSVPLVTVFQTSTYSTGSELSLTLKASGLPTAVEYMSTESSHEWPNILMGSELFVANASRLDSHISGMFSYGNDIEFAGEIDAKKMPTDWRSYVGQDVIVFTTSEWRKLDPGARTAILEWNRLGGRILLYASNSSDDLANLQIDPNLAGKRSTARSQGHVSIVNLPSNKHLDPSSVQGRVYPHRTSKTSYSSLLSNYSASWPLHRLLGEKNFNTAFFILILLAFGILVGPVNLFVFAKAGKRHKLFVTTPIISLAASALLIVIIMLQDGFGGRGHRVLLMEISPEDNKAYITQEQIARTGVLLGSSFETTEPCLITPVALSRSRWARVVTDGKAPSTYSANETSDGIKFTGDWFQSRSEHGHLLKTVRPTRGRIELSPKAGPPMLTSTFDYDLGEIFYLAPDNTWWRAEALAKGNSVALSPASKTLFNVWLSKQRDGLSKTNSSKLDTLARKPGYFYTTSDDVPAIESYDSIKWLSTKTILTGKVSR